MKFVFTPENLIENIDKLGPWSAYALASEALQYYFPNEWDEENYIEPTTTREAELLNSMGFDYWQDVIIKYHKEVGYKGLENTRMVNEH